MFTSGWKEGDHLVIDDGTGEKIYRSAARKLWNGTIQRADHFETRQPQEFVRARKDPTALRDVRPETLVAAPDLSPLIYVGNTTIAAPTGAATHLFDVGIGSMSVGPGGTFKVR